MRLDNIRMWLNGQPLDGVHSVDLADVDASPLIDEATWERATADLPRGTLQFTGSWDDPTDVPPPTEDVLAAIDAATGDLCACGCQRPLDPNGVSAYFASADCQRRWSEQQATNPHEVRGSQYVDSDQMRWRPDLVSEAPDEGLEPLGPPLRRGRFTQQMFIRADTGGDVVHLRLDDGNRFVGVDVDGAASRVNAPDVVEADWARLERELGDHRRLAPTSEVRDEAYRWDVPPARHSTTAEYHGTVVVYVNESAVLVHADLREEREHIADVFASGAVRHRVMRSWSGTLRRPDVDGPSQDLLGVLGERLRIVLPGDVENHALARSVSYDGEGAAVEVVGDGPLTLPPARIRQGGRLTETDHVVEWMNSHLSPITLTLEQAEILRRQFSNDVSHRRIVHFTTAAAYWPREEPIAERDEHPMLRAIEARRQQRNSGPPEHRRVPRRIDPPRR